MKKTSQPALRAGLLAAATTVVTVLAALAARPAAAECRLAQVQLTPEANLQIAVWLEDSAGQFVDTLFVTRATGGLGLGNRPGRFDFNTNYRWPYGRRDGVLPVWAHRRGVTYPQVVFGNGLDSNLTHPANDSSPEAYYCRPLDWDEYPPDAISCPTATPDTDKGRLSSAETSFYPPRNDIVTPHGFDDPSVAMYGVLNDLDAVSRATPPGGQPFQVLATLDPDLPPGEYTVWVEVHRELDYNDTYNPLTYPAPVGIASAGLGDPYRGQPSLVWQVPITLAAGATSAQALAYVGYGDPDGLSGDLSPPDATIDAVAGTFVYDQDGAGGRPATTYPTFGEARLQLASGADGMYRVRVEIEPSDDIGAPGPSTGLTVDAVDQGAATLHFIAPGDDGDTGVATEYEVRYRIGAPLTEADFATGTLAAEGLVPVAAGERVSFTLPGLLPETIYSVGVRAKDECLVAGAAAIVELTTAAAVGGEVDQCFVATAAWGSLLEPHVTGLRRFRDRALRHAVLGEIFVEAYYTFAPALAEIIEPSETLRQLARSGLAPLVTAAEDAVE